MNKHVNAQRLTSLTTVKAGVTATRKGVNLGAEISGVDLRKPLLDEQFKAIDEALVVRQCRSGQRPTTNDQRRVNPQFTIGA